MFGFEHNPQHYQLFDVVENGFTTICVLSKTGEFNSYDIQERRVVNFEDGPKVYEPHYKNFDEPIVDELRVKVGIIFEKSDKLHLILDDKGTGPFKYFAIDCYGQYVPVDSDLRAPNDMTTGQIVGYLRPKEKWIWFFDIDLGWEQIWI